MALISLLFFLLLVIISILFTTKRQFMTALLILETLVLVSLVLSLLILNMGDSSLFIFIMLLTLGVCEAALALGLLVSYIKLNGSDLIKVLSRP
uniref:NADH dehydrogenase subunit 4L n=1 Tax=Megalophaedusa hosayaka TaxID=1885753 RepID=A0A224ACG6_9EUPU|nr:NADH dehydrogenase subunit 4L [Megalophaedusa hosayaka]